MTELDRTTPAIASWLTERVAYYLEREPGQIAPQARLVELGLDSVYALTLCGDIEDEFGLPVESTLAWDHPTVLAIADFLQAELAAREPGRA